MALLHYRIVRESTAPAETLFEVLNEPSRWPRWAPLVRQAGWEDGGVIGVGAVRLVGSPPVMMREQVTVHEPPTQHGYTLLSTMPARDYHALVELTPHDSGTTITWTGNFKPNPVGIGHAYGVFVKWYIRRLARALAREAERRA